MILGRIFSLVTTKATAHRRLVIRVILARDLVCLALTYYLLASHSFGFEVENIMQKYLNSGLILIKARPVYI